VPQSYVSPLKIALLASIAALGPAAAAHATTYCVSQTDPCPAGTTSELSVQAALNAAATDSPGPNVVRLGSGTYDAAGAGFDYSTPGAPPVQISGMGQGLTTLRADSSPGFVLRVAIAGSSVTDLSIAVRAPMTAGLVLDNAAAQRVDVTGSGDLPSTDGVQLNDGASFSEGGVSMPSSAHAALSQGTGATGTVSDAHLTARIGLTAATSGQPGLAARDVFINATDTGVLAPATSTITVDEALVLMHGANPTALQSTNGSLTVRGATIVSLDRQGTGAAATATGTSTAELTVQDAIVRGFDTALTRSSTSSARADLTAQYDDVHATGGGGSGPGALTVDHNIDADPQFVDAAHGDYHLSAHSPAIDAGGPCDSACASMHDLAGIATAIDGNGDGSAVRDIGGYEYGHTPPNAAIAAPASVSVRTVTAYNGQSSSDADDGDQLSYAWTFDDGGQASGPIGFHAFTTAGQHRVTLTVTDPTGLTSTAVAYVQVSADPVGSQGGRPSHQKAPAVTSLSFSPSAFAVGPGPTAVSARNGAASRGHSDRNRRHGPSGSPVGTSIRFRLSVTATVTITLQRIVAGRSSHGHCATGRRGRPCTLYKPAGTLIRKSLPAGRATIAFSGRVGTRALASGSYLATVAATDGVRHTSSLATAHFTVLAR
jgi:PKD repeat protein